MPANVTAWACLVLGVVIMFLTMMFVTRFLTANANAKPANLTKFVAILLTGTVIGFLTAQLGAEAKEFAWYAIGLGVGLLIYAVSYAIGSGGVLYRTKMGPRS